VRPSIGQALAFDAYGQRCGAVFIINSQLRAVRVAEIELGKITL
jgi:hypothetical protein